MRKIIFGLSILLVCLVIVIFSYIFLTKYNDFGNRTYLNNLDKNETDYTMKDDYYTLYNDTGMVGTYSTLEEAIQEGEKTPNSYIMEKGKRNSIWDNFVPFNVFVNYETTYTEFYTFAEALEYAKQYDRAFIYYRKNNSLLWSSEADLPPSHIIEDVPVILQMPELPRGCEITSLAMLMAYNGVYVDKLVLADEIKKDETPYKVENGIIYYGNPNVGFVGDMKNINNNGLGVYHEPIYDLLLNYFPDSAIDLTGAEFEDILQFIIMDKPVWVIVNTTFEPLPSSEFVTWQTEQGPIDVTYREHSVLITGYDEYNVYFNDPLVGESSASKKEFILAWEQMGKQAITIN